MVTKPMPRTPKRCRLKLENHLRFRTCWARGVLYVQYAGGDTIFYEKWDGA